MANCPACGCEISGAARFCPMCGITIRQEAVSARFGEAKEIPVSEPPEVNDEVLRRYVGMNHCGAGVVRALRAMAVLLSVVIGVCGIVYGVMLLLDGSKLHGIISLVIGPGVGLLLYVIMTIAIILYENISYIARHTETQNRIAVAQLELINTISRTQSEQLELSRQTAELLKVMDGDRFDAAKQAERQTRLLEKLEEAQRLNEQKLASLRSSSELMAQTMVSGEKNSQSWRSNTRQFAHAIALAVSQIPDRLRDVLRGDAAEEETDILPELGAEDSDCEAEPSADAEATE